ncbi:MAG: cysteine desulfurase [Deltaproteobacteria bacterium]|nr:cysteine desulfurase [Deltaproteobacteria bacterium]
MPRIYLDYNATTPLAPEVRERLLSLMGGFTGNPSSLHREGREGRSLLNEARAKVASLLHADPAEVIFTSGGTESINLALKGVFYGSPRSGKKNMVTTSVEHSSVHQALAFLAGREGVRVTSLPVDHDGRVSLEEYEKSLPETLMVSVTYANNETGVIFPIREMASLAKSRGVLFHLDAVQGAGRLPLNVKELGIDLLSFSGHKIYGPTGTGVLYCRRGVSLAPLIQGGSQEREKRGGTENIFGIAGLATAFELVSAEREKENERLKKMRQRIETTISQIPGSFVNSRGEARLANTLNFSFEGISNQSLLASLDLEGFAISGGSACASGSMEPSHVLIAMGQPREMAKGAVRVSLGRPTTEKEVDQFLSVLPGVVQRLREAR